MRSKIISNYLAVLHYELDAFQFRNIRDWVARDCDNIGELARLDYADAVRPSQHFRRIIGNGAVAPSNPQPQVPQ